MITIGKRVIDRVVTKNGKRRLYCQMLRVSVIHRHGKAYQGSDSVTVTHNDSAEKLRYWALQWRNPTCEEKSVCNHNGCNGS